MRGCVQIAHEVGVELEVVNLILLKAGRVQQHERLTDSVHVGLGLDIAHAVLGRVGDRVYARFLGQALDGHGLQRLDHRGGVGALALAVVAVLGGGLCDQRGDFLIAHAGLDFGQLLGQLVVLGFPEAGRRLGDGHGGALAAHEELAGDIGERAVRGVIAEQIERVDVVHESELIARGRPVIDDVGDHVGADAAALAGEQRFQAQRGDDRVHSVRVKAVLGDVGDRLVHRLAEERRIGGVHAGGREHHGRFGAGDLDIAAHVGGGQRFLHVLHEHGAAVRNERGEQVELIDFLVGRALQNNAVIDGRAVFDVAARLNAVLIDGFSRLGQRRVARVLYDDLLLVVLGEVAVEQLQKGGVVLKAAVEAGQRVGGMIVFLMIGDDVVVAHLGNVGGVAAEAVARRAAREERLEEVEARGAVQRVRAAHFAVDGARDGQIAVGAAQRIAPAFLVEQRGILGDHRVEAAVGVVVGVFEQLRLGQRGHGIGGHDAVGGGVHVGVVGLIGQVEEQLLRGILLGAVQRGVFKNMRNAHFGLGGRAERDFKHAVGVLVGQIHELRAGLVVLEQHDVRAQQLEAAHALDGEALDRIAHGGQRGFVGLRRDRECQQRQKQRQKQRHAFFHMILPPFSCDTNNIPQSGPDCKRRALIPPKKYHDGRMRRKSRLFHENAPKSARFDAKRRPTFKIKK